MSLNRAALYLSGVFLPLNSSRVLKNTSVNFIPIGKPKEYCLTENLSSKNVPAVSFDSRLWPNSIIACALPKDSICLIDVPPCGIF